MSISESDRIAETIVSFSRDGAFPEEEISNLEVQSSALGVALQALSVAREDLEVR
jgi:hypothetical protein